MHKFVHVGWEARNSKKVGWVYWEAHLGSTAPVREFVSGRPTRDSSSILKSLIGLLALKPPEDVNKMSKTRNENLLGDGVVGAGAHIIFVKETEASSTGRRNPNLFSLGIAFLAGFALLLSAEDPRRRCPILELG
ncbi:hypothetical protein BHE74_00037608 [Ensete ventricosum]|nr:hypothetical protein BHE74_00037608 [Ensete ventricosum]